MEERNERTYKHATLMAPMRPSYVPGGLLCTSLHWSLPENSLRGGGGGGAPAVNPLVPLVAKAPDTYVKSSEPF